MVLPRPARLSSDAASPLRDAYSHSMDVRVSEAFRRALLAERARLLGEIGETIRAPDQMTYGSQAAAASQVFEQQRDLALRDRAQQHLALVDAALRRLDEGSFGNCVRCGTPIPPERLEALPWAAHCIDCQTIVDRGQR
jgi:DnaK suppressor protein